MTSPILAIALVIVTVVDSCTGQLRCQVVVTANTDTQTIAVGLEIIAQLSSQSAWCAVTVREIASKADIPCRQVVLTSDLTWANNSAPQSERRWC